MDDVTACDESGIYRHDRSYLTQHDGGTMVAEAGKRTWREGCERTQAIHALVGDREVLYAFRLPDGVIKIGWTRNLAQRRTFIKGAEIIGFTFGDYEDEQAIHRSLRAHVARGREYYHATPEVLAVINQWREPFNLEPLAS